MDMGIVNAAQVEEDVYEKIDKELLGYVEDVLLNRCSNATERMLEFAATLDPKSKPTALRKKGAEGGPLPRRRMTPRRGAPKSSASASSTRSSRASTSSASPTPRSAARTATTLARCRSSRAR